MGCGACYIGCPNEAVILIESLRNKAVTIKVDGENFTVPEGITVKQALEILGYTFAKFPGEDELFAPCEVGGCWSCAVDIDKSLMPSCVTRVRTGMEISIETIPEHTPRRIVHNFSGHTVGGVGTPWWLKSGYRYIEATCFACGCNFRCPQCQNWTTAYCGKDTAFTPLSAAEAMTAMRRRINVERMAISGGESTLNRTWLVNYVRELKRINSDKHARIHVDTNASILTEDYIDELVEAGITDIGPDLKSLSLDTFMRITGLGDKRLAGRYLETSWNAVRYLVDNYSDKVFIGIGIPYNRNLISLEEIRRMGEEIYKIDCEIQVCVLDYRPEFRRLNISRPSYKEMITVHSVLREAGLKTVICQTESGHIGPET